MIYGFLVIFKNGKQYVYKIPFDVSLNTMIRIIVKYVEDKRVSIIDAAKGLLEHQNISGDVKFRWFSSIILDSNTIMEDINEL